MATTLGVVLGGGGARGLAHIGVLRALEQADLRPDIVVGVSMGAIIGAAYAARDDWFDAVAALDRSVLPGHADFAAAEGLDLVKALLRTAVDMAPKVLNFGRSGGFEEFGREVLAQLLGTSDGRIEDLRVPFAAVSTDLDRGDRAVLRRGDLIGAVLASSALPIMTVPVELDGTRHLDGGFADAAPIDVARDLGADVVMMVHVGTAPISTSDYEGPVGATIRGLEIGLSRAVDVRLSDADLVVRPLAPDGVSWLSFDRAEEMIRIGHHAMARQMDGLRALLAAHG